MTVSLKNNLLANARGITFQDANGITWGFNPNTNQITATYTGNGSAGAANPSAKVGLTTVNGSAATFMRSDGAPALDQSIAPTWTGKHIWSASGNGFGGTQGTYIIGVVTLYVQNAGTTNLAIKDTTDGVELQNYCYSGGGIIGTASNHSLAVRTNNTTRITIASGGAVTVAGNFAINNGTPSAPLSGFGSPSGTVTSGLSSSATLAQTAGTLAALLAYLKTIGIVAA